MCYMKKNLGRFLIAWGIIFSVLLTNFFGNNFIPEAKEELLCDITSIVIILCGYLINRIR